MIDTYDEYDLTIERVRGLLDMVLCACIDDPATFAVTDAYTELDGVGLDPHERCDSAEIFDAFDGPVMEPLDGRTALVLAIEELAYAMTVSRNVNECVRAGVAAARLTQAPKTFPTDA